MDNAFLVYRLSDGLIVNAIAYDGQKPYNPGEGMGIVPLGDSGVWIGWTYNAETGQFTLPKE